MQSLVVTITNASSEHFQLIYDIDNTESAQIWAKSLLQAHPFGFRETDRFDGFPNHRRNSVDHLIERFSDTISKLQKLLPSLKIPSLDQQNLQASLNHLHQNFAHSHLVEKSVNSANSHLWTDFNTLIHAIEHQLAQKNFPGQDDISMSRIVMTWKKPFQTPIPENSYQDFTLTRNFGVAYANYCQVGRQIMEIFRAQDDQLPDEHIRPSRFIGADVWFWFGSTVDHSFESHIKEQLCAWFEQRRDRMNRLGLFWNDPKLSLGQIPVARLRKPVTDPAEIRSFVQFLSRFDRIHSAKIVSHLDGDAPHFSGS